MRMARQAQELLAMAHAVAREQQRECDGEQCGEQDGYHEIWRHASIAGDARRRSWRGAGRQQDVQGGCCGALAE